MQLLPCKERFPCIQVSQVNESSLCSSRRKRVGVEIRVRKNKRWSVGPGPANLNIIETVIQLEFNVSYFIIFVAYVFVNGISFEK